MISRTILVVDEDTDTRIILRALLERHDYTVIDAANAQQAITAARQALCLIVLNHPMSVTPTLSLAQWLRAEPHTHSLPIINLTSRAVPALIEEAARHGVTLTLAKPIDVQQMLQVVNELTALVPA